MSLVTGKVTCLQIEDDRGYAGILEPNAAKPEFFILWSNPDDPSAFTRIMQSMWISLLKDSLLTAKSVELSFDDQTHGLIHVRLNNI